MKRAEVVSGIGGIAFGILYLAAMLVANGPGGSYSASDIAAYVASGHRVAVFVAMYAALLGCVGLVALLARLRDIVSKSGSSQAAGILWGSGLGGAASLAVGFGLLTTLPLSMALGGGKAFDPRAMYAFTQAGLVVIFAAGGVLVGVSMIVLAIGSAGALSPRMRAATAVAGALALASPAFFPFFALLLWSVGTGIWCLTSTRSASTAAPPTSIAHAA